MSWKLIPVIPHPQAEIEWTGLFGRTRLVVEGNEIPPNEEVKINIAEDPVIKLVVVGKNIGETGTIWVADLIDVKYEGFVRTIPLFIKEASVVTGGTIVGKVEMPFTELMSFIFKAIGRHKISEVSIYGLVGHGTMTSILPTLPKYYIRIIGGALERLGEQELRWRELIPVYSMDNLIKTISDLIDARRKFELYSLAPVKIPAYGISIDISRAGFDYYWLSQYAPIYSLIAEEWGALRENADDNTLEVKM